MCRHRAFGLQPLLLILVAAFPRAASADPVVLTSGFVEAAMSGPLARGELRAPGFFITFGADGFTAPIRLACGPCAPGTTVHLGGFFSQPRAAGTAHVDGVTYPEIFFDDMTGTFDSPSFQITGTQTMTVTSPFSFSGEVSGYVLDPFVHGLTEPAFVKSLSGQGTARATFSYMDPDGTGGTFDAIDLRYDFTGSAPVPEPGTLLLCGAGAAVIALRRRRKVV